MNETGRPLNQGWNIYDIPADIEVKLAPLSQDVHREIANICAHLRTKFGDQYGTQVAEALQLTETFKLPVDIEDALNEAWVDDDTIKKIKQLYTLSEQE